MRIASGPVEMVIAQKAAGLRRNAKKRVINILLRKIFLINERIHIFARKTLSIMERKGYMIERLMPDWDQ